MRQITYKIHRFDGQKEYVQDYCFPYQAGKTLLWGLIEIKENSDASLAFTAACRSAVCGACAVRVNGQAVLACETSLDSLLEKYRTDTLTLAPLRNFTVIRDLIVDWDEKTERLAAVKPWLIPQDHFSAAKGCVQSGDDFKKINVQAGCILCGACASECAKLTAGNGDFLEPFAYSKTQKFVADSRDQAPLKHLEPSLQQGLWKCMHCMQCVAKCPKRLAPARDISRLRQASIKMGLGDNPGARHARAFWADIAATGRLNEMKLGLRTEGLLKSLQRLPQALRFLRRGKLNPLQHPGSVKGLREIQAILRAVKEVSGK